MFCFRRTKATRLPCHPEGPIGQRTSSRCSPSGRARATSLKRLLNYWDGSRVEAEGRMARSEGGAPPSACCNDRATPPAALLPRAVDGCVDFGVGLRCSLGRDGTGYRLCQSDSDRFAPWPTPKSTATRPIPILQHALRPRSRAAERLRLERDKAEGVAILLARYRWLALAARKS